MEVLFMFNLKKKIIFRDGITYKDGETVAHVLRVTDKLRSLGFQFNLILNDFEIYDDIAVFEWEGTKYDVLRYYTYYSKYITKESLKTRKKTQIIILNK